MGKRYKGGKAWAKRNCEKCNKEFERRVTWFKKGKGRFCSHECSNGRDRGGSVTLNCVQCKKEYKIRKARYISKGSKFCSLQCWKDSGTMGSLKGEDHPNWTGKGKESHRIRGTKQYKEWRISVLDRDNWSCVLCGYKHQKPRDIRADHIKPFHLHEELRFDISNGRTLCVPCDLRHGWMVWREGRKKKL